jgi:hypothetical protein
MRGNVQSAEMQEMEKEFTEVAVGATAADYAPYAARREQ